VVGTKRRPGQVGVAGDEDGLATLGIGHRDHDAGRVAGGDPRLRVRPETFEGNRAEKRR